METTLFPGMDGDGDFQGRPGTETIPGEPPRVRRPDRAQVLLEPVCLDDRLPAEHPARLIGEVVRHLDLAAFYAPIAARGSEPGRPATDPQLLVALWRYATVDGVGNGRCRAGRVFETCRSLSPRQVAAANAALTCPTGLPHAERFPCGARTGLG